MNTEIDLILSSCLYVFSIFIVDRFFYSIGRKEEKFDIWWFLSLLLAIVLFKLQK